jgi:putative tryptophan/tyrosine transport system substrate-binding protein
MGGRGGYAAARFSWCLERRGCCIAARGPRAAQVPLIGYLGNESPDLFETQLRSFRQGLSAVGYDEGRNVAIEYRWAEGHNERLPAMAADLVRHQVTVIAAPASVAAALAAKSATSTIPIVFETGADPVALGLIVNLNRPSGNITGVTSLNAQVGPKRLELLHEIVPTATTFALLVNPTNPKNAEAATQDLQEAARQLGLQLHILNASTEGDFDTVFATLVELRVGGLVIANETFYSTRSKKLAELALRHSIPAIHQSREFATFGGLMSYGGSVTQSHYQAGVYVGRILKGEKVGDLPVQQVTKVELTISLKTAKAFGLTVPLPLIGRADEVIE